MSIAAANPQRTAWRFFPLAMIGALALVVVVNGGMIWAALSTFPGVAATDVFDHSNNYDAVLGQAGREAALGWKAQVSATSVLLTDRDGQALTGATVVASARRPVGPDQTTTLTFLEGSPGHYVTPAALPTPGQWDLRLTITHGVQVLHATRRILVK